MSRGARQRVAEGIFRDAYGYGIQWRERGRAREKRFPSDTPLERLKAWRARRLAKVAEFAAADRGGSFTRDVARFLKPRHHLPSFKSTRAHLRPWVHLFGKKSRWDIEHDRIQAAVGAWAMEGYSAREIRHRVATLEQLFRQLAPGEPTPCDDIKLPRIAKARPRRVSDDTIREVALQLYRHEQLGRLRDAKTRARFLVLATTGVRPVQLQRASRADLARALETRIWNVEPAKGDRGTSIYLNEEMFAAVQLLVRAKAFGAYDSRSFSKTLRRNGWPKGIRPYNARHAVGQALRRAGAELGDIQDHLGHRSPTTTRGFYLEPELERLKATSARLEGRLTSDAFLPPVPSRSAARRTGRHAKDLEKTGRSKR